MKPVVDCNRYKLQHVFTGITQIHTKAKITKFLASFIKPMVWCANDIPILKNCWCAQVLYWLIGHVSVYPINFVYLKAYLVGTQVEMISDIAIHFRGFTSLTNDQKRPQRHRLLSEISFSSGSHLGPSVSATFTEKKQWNNWQKSGWFFMVFMAFFTVVYGFYGVLCFFNGFLTFFFVSFVDHLVQPTMDFLKVSQGILGG